MAPAAAHCTVPAVCGLGQQQVELRLEGGMEKSDTWLWAESLDFATFPLSSLTFQRGRILVSKDGWEKCWSRCLMLSVPTDLVPSLL